MVTAQQGLDLEALEGMVNRHGTAGVLSMLAEICRLKADHITENWQDFSTAQWWDARATAFEKLEAKPFMKDA